MWTIFHYIIVLFLARAWWVVKLWYYLATSTLSSVNFTDGNIVLKERTHSINNKTKLHIPGVPENKLGNYS